MDVLIGAEFSGVVRDAFLARGHNAYSVDLLPTRSRPDRHFQCDVRELLGEAWDLFIVHLPCTYFTNASVRWFTTIPAKPKPNVKYGADRWVALDDAAAVWNDVVAKSAHIPKMAMENPIPHKYARAYIGPYTQTIQPYQFGHDESKRTCLWLRGLPQLQTTKFIPPPYKQSVHEASPGPDRWAVRSVTFQGIADAMAEQWGS